MVRLSVLMVRLSAQNTPRGFGERLAGVREPPSSGTGA
jgi:hypothetical protein